VKRVVESLLGLVLLAGMESALEEAKSVVHVR